MVDDILFSSSSDEWGTPRALFDQISDVFGPFNLDPCATAENAKADAFYVAANDGLQLKWVSHLGGAHPANVFVNPPFCRKKKMPIEPWIEKAWDEVQKGNASQVVMLIPARTETRIWHDVVFRYADFIGFIKGRVQFDGVTKSGKPNSATFPSAIVVFRRRPGADRFRIPPHVTTWEQRREDTPRNRRALYKEQQHAS